MNEENSSIFPKTSQVFGSLVEVKKRHYLQVHCRSALLLWGPSFHIPLCPVSDAAKRPEGMGWGWSWGVPGHWDRPPPSPSVSQAVRAPGKPGWEPLRPVQAQSPCSFWPGPSLDGLCLSSGKAAHAVQPSAQPHIPAQQCRHCHEDG